MSSDKLYNGYQKDTCQQTENDYKQSPREAALREAIKLTCGDRNVAYGPPTANLERLADLIRAYFGTREITTIQSTDVAAINILIKLARLATNPTHHDSWVDAAAYAGIGLECSKTLKVRASAAINKTESE